MMRRLRSVALGPALVLWAHTVAAQAPATPEEFARRQYDSGLAFLRAGQYAEALKDFQAVVDSYAATTIADDAQLAIARYQLEIEGDAAAAQATAEGLLKKFPSSDSVPMAYVVAGRAQVARGMTPANVEAALASFERVPRLFPGTEAVAPAVFASGDTLRRLGRCEEAMDRFGQVQMEYPRSSWASLARLSSAACLAAANRPLDAFEALQQVIVSFPESPQAAQARLWNTILYRLYVRPPAQPPYTFSGRTIAGPGGRLRDVTALGLGGDGSLYVGHRSGVLVLDSKGAPVRSAGSVEARGLFVDGRGRLVLVQKALLQQDAGDGPPLQTLTVPRPDAAQARVLDDLTAVAQLPTGDRLVADRSQRAVYRFDDKGKFVAPFASVRAHRIAVGPGEQVALLDRDAKGVTVVDREGKPISRIMAKGEGYELQNPADVAYDALGHLYVLDNAAMVVFAPDGRPVTTFAVADRAAPGAFRNAAAFALDEAARLYIYDDRAERVQVYQ
jgi:TolA-binding protein